MNESIGLSIRYQLFSENMLIKIILSIKNPIIIILFI